MLQKLTPGLTVDIEALFKTSDIGGIPVAMFRDALPGQEYVVRIKGDNDTAIPWRVRVDEVEDGCAAIVTPLEAMASTYASDVF